MSLAMRVIAALLLTGAAALLLASSAMAQERVGVVTNIEGTAVVARLTEPQAQPLRFKDDVFLRDRITTGERSFVRVLLGGRATVTARERSILSITEVPGLATIQLGEGRISVAVSRALMKPGQVIEIKTPNAVTAIRGTVVVAEVAPMGASHRSTITILRGLVEVTGLDATGGLVGPAVKVGALERVAVTGSGPVSTPETITPEAARRLASEFSLVPKDVPSASREPLNAALKAAATQDALEAARASIRTPPTTTSTSGTVTTTTSTVTETASRTASDVTGAATGTVKGLTGTATGALGGLTSAPPVISPSAAKLTSPLVNTLTNTTTTVTNSLLPIDRK
jgi:hypothetical protein